MASSRCFLPNWFGVDPSILQDQRYFMITVTNFPNFLARTDRYQTPRISVIPKIERPNMRAQFAALDSEVSESILYNTLKNDIEKALRTYLEQTEQLYPISLVFDMSDLKLSR